MARLKIPRPVHLLVSPTEAQCGARWPWRPKENLSRHFTHSITHATCFVCLKRHTLNKVTLRLKQ